MIPYIFPKHLSTINCDEKVSFAPFIMKKICLPHSVTRLGYLMEFQATLATINLSKSPTFLGNFCKGFKSIIFLQKSLLGNCFRHLAILFWSHCCHSYLEQLKVGSFDRPLLNQKFFEELQQFRELDGQHFVKDVWIFEDLVLDQTSYRRTVRM